MYKCVTPQADSSLPDLFTSSWSPSHIDLCCLKVSLLVPLQWGHQTLYCFGFPTYPHTSHMWSPISMWPKSYNIAVFALALKSAYEGEHILSLAIPKHRKGTWLLNTSIIGNYSISHPEGQFSTSVGNLTCLGQKFYNDTAQETQWWGAPNHTKLQPHPLASFSNFRKTWDNLTANIDWQAPRGLYWILRSKLIQCYLVAGLGPMC
jgi:hypothetical protein